MLSNDRLVDWPPNEPILDEAPSDELPNEGRLWKDRMDDPPRAASPKERLEPPLNERTECSPPPLKERDDPPLNDWAEWPEDMP
jgi:hypothetical protein